MTMVGENGPELAGWRLPPRCCGLFCDSLACTICGQWVALGKGEN